MYRITFSVREDLYRRLRSLVARLAIEVIEERLPLGLQSALLNWALEEWLDRWEGSPRLLEELRRRWRGEQC